MSNRSQTFRLVAGAAALAAIAGFGLNSLASSALFTDQESTSAATLSTGTIAITTGGSYSTNFPTSGMLPGDAKYGTITVINGGADARLSSLASWSAANELSNALEIRMVAITSTDVCDSTTSFSSPLNSAVKPATSTDTTVTMFGDPTAGDDTGDRALADGATNYYCVQLLLPSATGNTVQDKTSSLTFTFDAEQTANNA